MPNDKIKISRKTSTISKIGSAEKLLRLAIQKEKEKPKEALCFLPQYLMS